MRLEPAAGTRTIPPNLAQAIERQIVQRTWGRIHQLAVEVENDRVVVHGLTSSYYSKQLALQGALDAIGSSGATEVDLDIEVSSPRPMTAFAHHASGASPD